MPPTGPAEKESVKTSGSRRGGPRPGAGRPKGRKNAATLEIEAAAKAHANDALKALLHVAQKSQNDSARVAAATAILDRAYGRPRQALEHSGTIAGGGVLAVPVPVTSEQWAGAAKAQQSALLSNPPKASPLVS
jgi:hypothetical protein